MEKKIHKIFCPTVATKNYLVKERIFSEKKIFVLKDPIISISDINVKKKKSLDLKIDLKKKNICCQLEELLNKRIFFLN